jgi:transposase
MAKSLFWLSDEAWEALSPHLPRGRPGKPRVDDRTVISGILHVLKTGCRWRDVPSVYGPPTTIYNRYNRWSQRRVWQRIFEKMAAAGPIPDELSIDSSHVKAHRSASGSKRGSLKKRSAARAAEGQARSMLWPMIVADRSLRADARKRRRRRHGYSASRRRRSTKARAGGQGLRRRQSAPMAQA